MYGFLFRNLPQSQSALQMHWSHSSLEKSNCANIISAAHNQRSQRPFLHQMVLFLSELSVCGFLITAPSPNYQVYFEHRACFFFPLEADSHK